MDALKSPPPQEAKLHFLDYWRIIRIRKTIILAVFFLVVITATVVTFMLPESFSSTARIRVERDATDITPMADRGYMGSPYDPYFIQTEFEVIQSQVILGKVITELNLNEEWGAKYGGGLPLKETESMEILKGKLDLRPVRNTSLIEITVYADKPEDAARIANKITQVYYEHRQEQAKKLMASGIAALKDSFALQAAEIQQVQSNVDWLRTANKISDPEPSSLSPSPTLSGEALRALTLEKNNLKDETVRREKQLTFLKTLDRPHQREAIQTALDTPDGQLANLLSDFSLSQQNFIKAQRDYQPEHVAYKTAQRLMDNLDQQIDKRVDGILLGLQNRLEATQARLAAADETLETAKTNDLAMAEISRPYYEEKQKLANQFQYQQMLNVKMSSEETDLRIPKNSMVEIVDNAVANHDPVRPKKTLNIVLGLVVGLVVGIALAFFIEYLDTSVKTIDDVERTLQAPVLGVIPQNVGLLLEEGAESPHAEAYRVLRTNLLFSRKDETLNSIAIVSAGAGEGKSTTVFNLATVFAQNGNRVVIVDSDLRRPTLHKMLRVTNSIGLTNYLLKQNTLEEVIQTTNVPTLDFMASGKLPSSSLGILSSSQMKALISDLKQRYDFVFFDSPPIMGVSDASILASEVDMTMQVIQYRRYPQPMNIRAKQMIEKVGGNLVGIVLNNINMSQDESYYYYSGYYHDYYAKNDESEPGNRPDGGAGDKGKLDIKPKY